METVDAGLEVARFIREDEKNYTNFIFRVKYITFWNVHDDRHILIGKKQLY